MTPQPAADLSSAPLPPAAAAPATVLFLPAMGVAASYYTPFVQALSAATGALVVPLDLPGQGQDARRARRGADYGYREVVEELLPRAVEQLAAVSPGPVVLAGHSLGGQLALVSLATLHRRVAGLVLVAAGTAHWRAWPAGRRWRAALAVHAIGGAAMLAPWYPGRRLGFGGDQARRFMRDWFFNARHGRYRLEGSSRTPAAIAAELAHVRLPVHAVTIEGDPVAPPGALQDLLSLVPQAAVHRHLVRGTPEDAPWQRHFAWGRKPGDVVAAVAGAVGSLAGRETAPRQPVAA
jgi:predicted alpha/beta hydrolase